jgi:hypothetical protein
MSKIAERKSRRKNKSQRSWSIKAGVTAKPAKLRPSFIVIAFRVFVCGVT